MNTPDLKVFAGSQPPLQPGKAPCPAHAEETGMTPACAETQKAFFQSQKMQLLGSLAGGVAHDFNNVFAAILLQLDLAIDQAELSPSIREDLEHAKSSANRGVELIKKLLSFCRPAPSAIKDLHPASLVRESIAFLERTITRRIHISAVTPEDLWNIKGDENQLHLLLINLCLNARDAMPNGGSIVMELSNASITAPASKSGRPGDFVRLAITDSSAGMPASVVERLLEEDHFTTLECAHGACLSLFIAKTVIKEHGGWLEIRSEPGKGTSFQVFLPRLVSQGDSSSHCAHANTHKESADGTETILVVDGDCMMRNLYRAVLAYRGYNIEEASQAEEMVEKVFSSDSKIDLILLNLETAQGDQWNFFSQLREEKTDLPILISASPDLESQSKALAAGARGLLSRPFSNQDLVKMVRKTLDLSKGK